jgi:hypothetical protein
MAQFVRGMLMLFRPKEVEAGAELRVPHLLHKACDVAFC